LRGGAPVTAAALDADADAAQQQLRVPLPGPLHSLHALQRQCASPAPAVVAAVLESGAVGCADFARGELEQAEAAEGAALAASSAGEGLAVAVRAHGRPGGVAVALYSAAGSAGLRRVPIALEADEEGHDDGETTEAEDLEQEEEEEEDERRGGSNSRRGRQQQQQPRARRRGSGQDAAAASATAATPVSLLHLPAPRGAAQPPALAGLAYWPGAYVAALWQGGAVTLRPLSAPANGAGAATVTAGPAAELLPGAFFSGGGEEAGGAEGAGRKRTKAAAQHAGGAAAFALAALGPAHLLLARVSSSPSCNVRHAVIDARFGVALASGSAELSGVPPTVDLSTGLRLLPMLPSGKDAEGRAVLVLGGQAAFALTFDMPEATLVTMVGRLALAGGVVGGASASATQGAVVVASSAAAAASTDEPSRDLLVPARGRAIDVASVLTPEQRLAAAHDAAPCALRPAAAAVVVGGGGGEGAAEQHVDEAAAAATAAATAAAAAAEGLARAVEAFEASAAVAAQLSAAGKKKSGAAHHDDAAADALEAAARRAAAALTIAASAAAAAAAASRSGGRGRASKAAAGSRSSTTDWRLAPRLLGRASAALASAKRWPALGALLSSQPPQTLLHCPRLLPALAAARQYDLVALVCASAEDVPAGAVVRAMCSVMSAAGQRAAAAGDKSNKPAPQPQQAAWRARVRACAERAVAQAEARPDDRALRAAAWRAAAAVDKPFTCEDVALHALAAAACDPVELTAALRRRLPSARAALRLVRYLGKWAERHARELPEGCSGGVEEALRLQQGGQQQQEAAALPREADEQQQGGSAAAFGAAGPLPARVLLLSPGYSQVLDLLRAVMDAQLTPLALLGERAAPELRRLQRTVVGAAARGGALAKLKGAAEHLAAGAPLPDAAIAAASNYTVELLDLRVAPPPAARGGGGQHRRSSGGRRGGA
jgi:hypothetical protein